MEMLLAAVGALLSLGKQSEGQGEQTCHDALELLLAAKDEVELAAV